MTGFIKPTRKKATSVKNNDTKKWREGIQQQIDTQSKPLNVQMIPLSQIRIDPKNARSFSFTLEQIENAPKVSSSISPQDEAFIEKVAHFFTDEHLKLKVSPEKAIDEYISLAQLAASIKEPENLINPVTAFLSGMDFQLVAGHRRTYAHHILNADFIATNIISPPNSDLTHFITQWNENENRLNLTLSEQLTNINHIIQSWENNNGESISITKLMNLLNLKKTKASWYLAVIKLMNKDENFRTFISSEYLESLEILFLLTTVNNSQERNNVLLHLSQHPSMNFAEQKKLIQEKKNVRTPDTNLLKSKKALVPKNMPRKKFAQKIIQLTQKMGIDDEQAPKISDFDFESKKGVKEFLEQLYKVIVKDM